MIDKNRGKFDQFLRWSVGGYMRPHAGSWRMKLNVLAAPQALDRPWLFTIDPMIFEPADGDDNQLHPADLGRLTAPVRSFLHSGRPGVFVAFCYSTQRHIVAFRQWIRDLAANAGTQAAFGFAEIPEYGHIGGMISNDAALLERMTNHWNHHWNHVRERA